MLNVKQVCCSDKKPKLAAGLPDCQLQVDNHNQYRHHGDYRDDRHGDHHDGRLDDRGHDQDGAPAVCIPLPFCPPLMQMMAGLDKTIKSEGNMMVMMIKMTMMRIMVMFPTSN